MPPDDNDGTSWGSEDAWREAAKNRTTTPLYGVNISSYSDIRALKYLIDKGYVISTAINSNKYRDVNDKLREVWTIDNYNVDSTNHANTVVGYDDNYNGSSDDITIK